MQYPIIYSNKKHMFSGDEVVLSRGPWTSSVSSDSVWAFPESTLGVDYQIVDGDIYAESITIKLLRNYEEFIIQQIISDNQIINSEDWTDTIIPGLADDWNAPTFTQTNEILTGWNFDGNSQRVTQSVGTAYILQEGVVNEIDEYQLALKYRASNPISITVGGVNFSLSATEIDPVAIYPIQHEAGEIDFMAVDGGNNKWILTDGTFANTSRITKTLPAGTSYLIMDNFNGSSITSIGTGLTYVGNLEDIPKNVSVIELENTNVSGNIAELYHIKKTVYISNSDGIYGDISSLSGLTDTIDLSGCSNITGDVGTLKNPLTIILDGCPVSGELATDSSFTYVNISNTNLSRTELGNSIINTSNRADSDNINNGYFEACENMPTISGSSECDAYFNLISRGWTVLVHAYCGGSWYGC